MFSCPEVGVTWLLPALSVSSLRLDFPPHPFLLGGQAGARGTRRTLSRELEALSSFLDPSFPQPGFFVFFFTLKSDFLPVLLYILINSLDDGTESTSFHFPVSSDAIGVTLGGCELEGSADHGLKEVENRKKRSRSHHVLMNLTPCRFSVWGSRGFIRVSRFCLSLLLNLETCDWHVIESKKEVRKWVKMWKVASVKKWLQKYWISVPRSS